MKRKTSTHRQLLRGSRAGFTVIEIGMVLVIAGILLGLAVPGFQKMQRNRAAQNARDSFVWLSNRARARAIETGTTQLLEINPPTDRAWIVRRGGTLANDTLQMVHYPTEYGSAVTTVANTKITVCYNPRGYAWECSPGNSPTTDVNITFEHAARSAVARVKPLGQVERL